MKITFLKNNKIYHSILQQGMSEITYFAILMFFIFSTMLPILKIPGNILTTKLQLS